MFQYIKLIISVISLPLVLICSTSVYAQDLEDRVSELEEKIGDQQQRLFEAYMTIGELEEELDSLKANMGTLHDLEKYVRIVPGAIEGLSGPHLIFEGVNVHVRNKRSASGSIDGLGNLIIGYNELGDETGLFYPTPVRSGSHNLVVGSGHTYSSAGGFVAGYRNTLTGSFSSITGGFLNTAGGEFSLVAGGLLNRSSGEFSLVSGGMQNNASSLAASIIGGSYNENNADVPLVSEVDEESSGQPIVEESFKIDDSDDDPEIELTFEHDGTRDDTSAGEQPVNVESKANKEKIEQNKDIITLLKGSRDNTSYKEFEEKESNE
ncbi:hypothetical protein MYX76_07335 [Desulfobacterota bacterium AH_259_B03_O07]|nr:hypothetical protein [Desulfobacterota bacterium AH_259_B03_O07]